MLNIGNCFYSQDIEPRKAKSQQRTTNSEPRIHTATLFKTLPIQIKIELKTLKNEKIYFL